MGKVDDNKIELNINFDELVVAFEYCNVENHFFIDLEENTIVNINEAIDLEAEEKLEQLESESKVYLPIPERLPLQDKMLMEIFAYGLGDLDLINEFLDALNRDKPFKRFRRLLDKYDMRPEWHTFKEKEIRNEVINWLVENDIKLVDDQEILKAVEVKELTSEEIDELDREVRDLHPIGCLSCDYKGSFRRRIFEVNVEPENKLDEIQIGQIMKEKFNVSQFDVFTGRGCYLTASVCPNCGSEEIFWDY